MAHRLLTHAVTGAAWVQLSADEVRRLSVKQLTNPQSLDGLGRPLPGGLYDAALGPTDASTGCASCGLSFFECPGHCGHIELAVPLYNPSLFPLLLKMLQLKCFACHRLRTAARATRALAVKLMLLDLGRYAEALGLDAALGSAAGGGGGGGGRGAEAVHMGGPSSRSPSAARARTAAPPEQPGFAPSPPLPGRLTGGRAVGRR